MTEDRKIITLVNYTDITLKGLICQKNGILINDVSIAVQMKAANSSRLTYAARLD